MAHLSISPRLTHRVHVVMTAGMPFSQAASGGPLSLPGLSRTSLSKAAATTGRTLRPARKLFTVLRETLAKEATSITVLPFSSIQRFKSAACIPTYYSFLNQIQLKTENG